MNPHTDYYNLFAHALRCIMHFLSSSSHTLVYIMQHTRTRLMASQCMIYQFHQGFRLSNAFSRKNLERVIKPLATWVAIFVQLVIFCPDYISLGLFVYKTFCLCVCIKNIQIVRNKIDSLLS